MIEQIVDAIFRAKNWQLIKFAIFSTMAVYFCEPDKPKAALAFSLFALFYMGCYIEEVIKENK